MRAYVFGLAALALGCGEQAVAETGFETQASGAASSGSGSGSGTAAEAESAPESGSSGGAGGSTSSGEEGGTTESVRFDVAVDSTTGGELPPLSCDTLDQHALSTVGCEFYGVQLPILGDDPFIPGGAGLHDDKSYGISVGNPGDTIAHVVIEDRRGPGWRERIITEFDVPPRGSVLTPLNGPNGVLTDEQHRIRDEGFDPKNAFYVRSDTPVTATQIHPVGGGPSHVSEASLLIPAHAWGRVHYAISYPHHDPLKLGFVTVVAKEDATTVTTTGGDVMLDAFDAHTFAPGRDVTGFRVDSDKPVAVFSGTECTMIPDEFWGACDHLEEQVIPTSSWGKAYVGARHPRRVPDINTSDEDVYWLVVAALPDTIITLEPEVEGMSEIRLGPGEFHRFRTPLSFVAESAKPFSLVQFMAGCTNVVTEGGGGGIVECQQGEYDASGDPYMIQMTAVEQWGLSIPFVTDTSYPRDFVVVTRERGTAVELECLGTIPDNRFTAVGASDYEFAQIDLDLGGMGGEGSCVDGAQFVSADEPVGLFVGGMDFATSYGYAGGARLEPLWAPPPPAG